MSRHEGGSSHKGRISVQVVISSKKNFAKVKGYRKILPDSMFLTFREVIRYNKNKTFAKIRKNFRCNTGYKALLHQNNNLQCFVVGGRWGGGYFDGYSREGGGLISALFWGTGGGGLLRCGGAGGGSEWEEARFFWLDAEWGLEYKFKRDISAHLPPPSLTAVAGCQLLAASCPGRRLIKK